MEDERTETTMLRSKYAILFKGRYRVNFHVSVNSVPLWLDTVITGMIITIRPNKPQRQKTQIRQNHCFTKDAFIFS